MKKWKMLTALFLSAMLAGGMAGCGSKAAYSEAVTEEYVANGWADAAASDTVYSAEEAYPEEVPEPDTERNAELTDSEKETLEEPEATAKRKLIRDMSISLETTGFDELQKIIEEKVEELGGYTESNTQDGTPDSGRRSGYMTVRIPADRLNDFEELLGNSATVLSKSSTVRDVTLSYSDLAAHISSLRVEQETLMDMLAKAEDVDTVIIIQNELTHIRYELESYESQMKVMENQISYSTVRIDIREVKIPTPQEKQGFISRVKRTFANSVSNLAGGIEDFFVFFFGNILGIILFIAVAAGVIWLLKLISRLIFGKSNREKKRKDRKRFLRKKKEDGTESSETDPAEDKE